jgi:arabinoxylan arabinofuranohydrolase
MTYRTRSLSALVLALLSFSGRASADYPIASHRYLADPGSLVWKDRIYLYNSNDDDNAVDGGYEMKSIVCVSTADLKNWTDHGVVFRVPGDAPWAHHSWAPQPVERDGTIYLYYGNNANGIGVATSKDPVAGFKDTRGSALIDSGTPGAAGTDIWLFDPGVLIDTDGQAYLAFGGNGENNARLIQLGSDLLSVMTPAMQLSPKGFFEASFLFKRNDIYYYAYSSDSNNGQRIDYLKSSSPLSGYTYGGVIADQPPENGNNNHASEFEYQGRWYHAYHNRIVAKTAGIADTYKRNLAIEVLDFNEDGTIKEVTYTTDGVPQVGKLNPYSRVEAETTNAQNGIETEPCSAGGMNVTSAAQSAWIRVRGVDFGSTGAKSFTASVAATAAGAIEIHADSASGPVIGKCDVPATGGAQTWATTTCDVTAATGVKDLVFAFQGSFGFDYWQFTPVDGGMGTGGAGANGAGMTGGVPGSLGGASGAAGGAPATSTGGMPASGGAGQVPTAGGNAAGAPAAAGGTAATTGGASTANGGSAAAPPPSSDDGCTCAVSPGARTSAAPLALLAAAWLAARSRRRSRFFSQDGGRRFPRRVKADGSSDGRPWLLRL